LATTGGEVESAVADRTGESGAQAAAPAQPAPSARRAGLPRHLANDALRRRMLAAADATAVLAATAVAGVGGWALADAFWGAVLLPVWIVLAKLHGLYDRDHAAVRHMTVDELGSLLAWATVGAAVTTPALALTPTGAPGLGGAVRMWVVLVLLAPLLRGLARALWRAWTAPAAVLLIGSGPLEKATHRKLELFHDIHMRVAGRLDMDAIAHSHGDADLAAAMCAACGGEAPDRVIVCTESVRETVLADIVSWCRKRRIRLSVVPPLRGAFGTAVRLTHVAELPFVEYHTGDPSISTLFLKRCADVTVAGIALVLTAPLFLVVAVAIKLTSRGPIFYVQRRAGLHGEPFGVLKFRTMVDGADAMLAEVVRLDLLADPMFKLRDDPRVTRVGRFLRRSSFDELPQLVNVLRGEMSLVGPRPEQLELVERYRPEHRFRLEARPGMTGPMQVFGRGDLGFDERLAVEREYIENVSLGRDVRILLMTFAVVFSGKGAF
jgi:exopolysaccharide biosynthesis polyprenyl glycosylphosphotransferase